MPALAALTPPARTWPTLCAVSVSIVDVFFGGFPTINRQLRRTSYSLRQRSVQPSREAPCHHD